jgi:hypothetical protein
MNDSSTTLSQKVSAIPSDDLKRSSVLVQPDKIEFSSPYRSGWRHLHDPCNWGRHCGPLLCHRYAYSSWRRPTSSSSRF